MWHANSSAAGPRAKLLESGWPSASGVFRTRSRRYFPIAGGLVVVVALGVLAAACADIAPESPQVVVVNNIGPAVMIKGVSVSGCEWDAVLEYGQATAPQRCLAGHDRVHFQKYDAIEYCLGQAKNATIENLCLCSEEGSEASDVDVGPPTVAPVWFNYQTVSVKHLVAGRFDRFVLNADDLTQDFSIPGPYGH
jgi:hypothetical protein